MLRFRHELYVGMTLRDRYVIQRELGRGGIGVVFLAEDRQLLARPVVVKVLLEEMAGSEHRDWLMKKFRQEIEALARINHPGVVGVLDAGQLDDGKPFLVMQYIDGASLRARLDGTQQDMRRTGEILRQIGHALGAAHDKGIVHRDLKPENVMLQRTGPANEADAEMVRLIDFGIAQVTDSQVTGAVGTRIAGSVAYMAPEQLKGAPSAASDIYALGVVAYEMLTGRMPFYPGTMVDLYEMQKIGVQVPPRQLRPELPVDTETAILAALSFDADKRPRGAREFGDTLFRTLTAVPVAAASAPLAATIISPDAPETPRTPPAARNAETVAESGAAPTGKRFLPAIIGAALLAVVALVWLWPRAQTDTQTGTQTNTQPGATAPVSVAAPMLRYSITAQRFRNGKPDGAAFTIPGGLVLDKGSRVHLNITPALTGSLYLLNEGPRPKNGLPDYNILFPTPNTNSGAARVSAAQTLRIPQASEFVLDNEEGTEKIWMIWSAAAIPEFEAVKKWANDTDRGEIKDTARISDIRDFLHRHESTARAEAEQTDQQTVLKSRQPLLTHLLRLEHR
ncbi:MAG: protein kinase domain-containing protein [Blastocatellia bacterium]